MPPIKLEDFAEVLAELALDGTTEVQIALESCFVEAARFMSRAGLRSYLEGAGTLHRLGRGTELVVSYLEAMPRVAKECGEEIIGDCVSAAMRVSPMTSGSLIALLFASLPAAAVRLGDANLVRGYLTLVHQVASTAPRGLRPMLGHIDDLLSKLTLSGLRNWVNFGAHAYRRDFDNLTAYFNLDSADSLAMLESERRGVLLVRVQRRLNLYLRALWGQDFLLRPTEAAAADFRPYLEQQVLHLPDALDDYGQIPGVELYRASAAHMVAHLMYSRRSLSAEQLSPAQVFFVGMMEDARVEFRAIQEFPGLASLWSSLMTVNEDEPAEHSTIPLLEVLARGLLDPEMPVNGDADLDRFVAKFHALIGVNGDDPQFSWLMGTELHNVFAGRGSIPSLGLLQRHRIAYRDDNRFIWHLEGAARSGLDGTEYLSASRPQVRHRVSPLLMATTLDSELAGEDAQEVWTCSHVMRVYEDDLSDGALTFNELLGTIAIPEPFLYPEWDQQIQLNRQDWVTVYEQRAAKGNPKDIDQILADYKPVTRRIRRIVDLLAPAGLQRQRRLEDGDEIDLNAAVDAMVALRTGGQPSDRITMRNVIQIRDLVVVVLLDLSESTNELVGDSSKTVLEVTREAATLVSTAIEGIGDPFAVHGFCSDGRHDVRYVRLKDFQQRFDTEAKARLAGMKGGLSTRMGAALRHAGYHLARQPERRKLVLLLTDGEPADIDESDPHHLRWDTKKAVAELRRQGVQTYCLTLDPEADSYVQRIFGAGGYTIIDRVERLPEQLPLLFASLTR